VQIFEGGFQLGGRCGAVPGIKANFPRLPGGGFGQSEKSENLKGNVQGPSNK